LEDELSTDENDEQRQIQVPKTLAAMVHSKTHKMCNSNSSGTTWQQDNSGSVVFIADSNDDLRDSQVLLVLLLNTACNIYCRNDTFTLSAWQVHKVCPHGDMEYLA
jgi:hypothetical protein